MESADIVTLIRRRGGLTRGELAARAGIGRTTLFRWEHGEQEPSLRALEQLAAATGMTLSIDVASADDSLHSLVDDQLRLEPQQRLAARLDGPEGAAAERALWWIAGRRWRVVLVGPVAGVLQGTPERPRDGVVDIVPESILRAGDLLLRAGATPLGPDAGGERWELPRGGQVSLVATPAGSRGYPDLARHATTIELQQQDERPRKVPVADVADLLRISMAADHLVERSRRPGLEALLQRGRAAATERHRR